ncbi:cytochrome c oxidase accessory protein CcoG [Bdellovibrio bacteriovorus]|uniref:Cytochrome c oxidase accessory protein CcoG n=1 Tax=Bdellovibrio bacteriovorus TaxID=959 RepID=A0A150WUV5_BDEBC|nr:cytochrome c oxidase accessory protein CcoG [Bdellovibrio bacteriovorus]KYG70298.1 cytochrome c oxidase accessory protein CcoG [Bdellovibrio bacteriovorus]
MNRLDPGKLTSVDENGDRLYLIPAEVRGFFRKHRTWSQCVLLVIFLLLPWTRINGHQTILIDIPKREFALFGILFRSHDAPLLFFVLGTLTLGLAFVTSIWGRVWCGWACPQTVFIDAVFRRIEQWVEGSYIERRRLRDAPLSWNKFSKVSLKWFLFFVASSLIAHSFMAYFVGAVDLMHMVQNSPFQNPTYFILVISFTALVLFDFAWFREQFCVIMCPYGRIQSVLLDSKSMAVVYDEKRGEPRKGSATKDKVGDCVSCNRCVQVCPTGIDIRNGLQMECIACTACIDACDEIMEKVKKPRGLIRYDTLDGSKINLKKPRSLIYMTAIIFLVAGLSYAIGTRESAHFTVLRGAGLPYSYVKNNEQELILNQFRIHIQNQSGKEALYQLRLNAELLQKGVEFSVAENPLPLKPGDSREWYFFVRIPPALFTDSDKIKTTIEVQDIGPEKSLNSTRELILVGPRQ